MNLPKALKNLVEAQNNFDSQAYANCFSETAIVADEGNSYQGKTEIFNWIEQANLKYKTTMMPIEYNEADQILTAEVSGNFPGSPLALNYHFTFSDGLIQSLKIV